MVSADITTVGARIESLVASGERQQADNLRHGMLEPYTQLVQALEPFAYRTLILIDKRPEHWNPE